MESKIIFTTLSKEAIYNSIYKTSRTSSYVAYIRGKRCTSEKSFFYEFSASLQFPWYFGENWDALDECLGDLDWISNDSIIIIIDDYSLIFRGNEKKRSVLVKILQQTTQYWDSNGKKIIVYLNN